MTLSLQQRSRRQPAQPQVQAELPRHAFTVDVEDYFQVSAFEAEVPKERWSSYECRVETNTGRMLDLLDRADVKATFFVVGWVADQYPELVRDIDRRGHEIGSHSYWHRLVYRLSPADFRDDLRRSRDVLQEQIGKPVTAYRAPSFSITRRSLWALDILADEGFQVDSSIVPVIHDRYGIPGAQRAIHRRETSAGPLWEIPPTVVRWGRYHLPVGGGGYFRLFPFRFTRHCLRRAARQTGSPLMFYIHPWEIDPQQPRLKLASRASRFRHYVNLSRTFGKLERLLTSFPFGTIGDLVERQARASL